jgi:SAM-dependent methyltransferase
MGLHAELISQCGGDLTTIDLAETSVIATQTRAELKNLKYVVRQLDASKLGFPNQSFNFVWSWGVIHHSSHTGRIIREIHRVLKPGGEVRAMVHNLEGMPAYITILKRYLLGFWRNKSLDQAGHGRLYSQTLFQGSFDRCVQYVFSRCICDGLRSGRGCRSTFAVPQKICSALDLGKKLSEWANKHADDTR